MNLFQYFKSNKKSSASLAKERLQVVVAHQRNRNAAPDYLPKLEKEILKVISKYVKIDADQVNVNLEQDNDFAVLELNITLPE